MPSSPSSSVSAGIFAVGRLVAAAGDVTSLPANLDLLNPRYLGSVALHGSDTDVTIETTWDEPVSKEVEEETVRMSSRVVQKRWPMATIKVLADPSRSWIGHLLADGFELIDVNIFRRNAGPFGLVAERSDHTYDVYNSVLDVHWNYVPAEIEAYQSLLAEPPLDVLDIGSGVGKNARVLAAAGHRVTALDASAWAIGRLRHFMPDVASTVSSVTSLPFKAGRFDAVVDIGCLHCLPGPERPIAVREVARVLRPGGRLFSRIFKPRDQAWVARQPFHAARFGMTDAEVLEMFMQSFPRIERTRVDSNMHYLTAWTTP